MSETISKILSIRPITSDVKIYRVEKPSGWSFIPGQATELSVNRPGWTKETRPFTFTSRVEDPWLEFTIKSYANRVGVTKLLDTLVPGDELLLQDVFGELTYRGPGLFIAGGTGITPFLAIFRDLEKKEALSGTRLLFGNRSESDVIEREELTHLLGTRFLSFTGDARIGIDDIRSTYRQDDWIYLCGPDPMVETLTKAVLDLGLVNRLVVEP